MPIAVDPSSPARATGSHLYDTTTVTTAAFNPPAGVLVACVGANSRSSPATGVSGEITNNGAALDWQVVPSGGASPGQRSVNDAGGDLGYAGIFVAVLDEARTGMTLTLTITGSTGSTNVGAPSIKSYVLTGAATADVIGGSNEGSSTANNLTTGAFTTAAADSLGFSAASDWNALGNPTSSDSTVDAFTTPGGVLSGASGYKTLGAAAESATLNLDAPGTGAARWNWVTAEVKAASVATPPVVEDPPMYLRRVAPARR